MPMYLNEEPFSPETLPEAVPDGLLAGWPQPGYECLIAAALRSAAQVTYAEPDQGELDLVLPWLRHVAVALTPVEKDILETLRGWATLPMRHHEPGHVIAQLLAMALHLRAERPNVAAQCLAQAAGLLVQQMRPKPRSRQAIARLTSTRYDRSWLGSLGPSDDSVLAALRLAGLLLCTPYPSRTLFEHHFVEILPDGLDTLSADETALGRAALLRYGGATNVDRLLSLAMRSTLDLTTSHGDVLALLLVLGDLRDQVRAA